MARAAQKNGGGIEHAGQDQHRHRDHAPFGEHGPAARGKVRVAAREQHAASTASPPIQKPPVRKCRPSLMVPMAVKCAGLASAAWLVTEISTSAAPGQKRQPAFAPLPRQRQHRPGPAAPAAPGTICPNRVWRQRQPAASSIRLERRRAIWAAARTNHSMALEQRHARRRA